MCTVVLAKGGHLGSILGVEGTSECVCRAAITSDLLC